MLKQPITKHFMFINIYINTTYNQKKEKLRKFRICRKT